jgi:hypothetical protein
MADDIEQNDDDLGHSPVAASDPRAATFDRGEEESASPEADADAALAADDLDIDEDVDLDSLEGDDETYEDADDE